MKLLINSVADLGGAVEQLLALAGKRKKMAFFGEIGAGKTTFIQAFCRHFKVEEYVTSPTFSLVNIYSYTDADKGGQSSIYHLDLYRLKNLQEALDIGIEEYLYDDQYCLIEWPETIEPILPEDIIRIKIEIMEDSKRKILIL